MGSGKVRVASFACNPVMHDGDGGNEGDMDVSISLHSSGQGTTGRELDMDVTNASEGLPLGHMQLK